MLSAVKLRELCKSRQVGLQELSNQIVRGGLSRKQSQAALKNWRRGLLKPKPRRVDVENLATALSAEVNDLVVWRSSYRYAPVSARKVRLVTELIVDRSVQDAMDVLKFTGKRAAKMVDKVLRAAVADADEQEADVDNLYVTEARVDDAGIRIGTKRWIPKDRGRAHPITSKASHIYVTVSET